MKAWSLVTAIDPRSPNDWIAYNSSIHRQNAIRHGEARLSGQEKFADRFPQPFVRLAVLTSLVPIHGNAHGLSRQRHLKYLQWEELR